MRGAPWGGDGASGRRGVTEPCVLRGSAFRIRPVKGHEQFPSGLSLALGGSLRERTVKLLHGKSQLKSSVIKISLILILNIKTINI